MMYRTVLVCCCLFTYVFSADSKRSAKRIINGPQNEAIELGPAVTMGCQASGPGEVVEWREYITNVNGAIISINNQTISHPNGARYSIIYDPATVEYDLRISPTEITDGGTYRCTDTSDSSTAYAQLVMLDGPPHCTSNIPSDGNVIEGTYYHIDCEVGYRGNAAPLMTWEGPEEWRGSWGQGLVTTNTSVSSGVNMNMSRYFDALHFSMLANFTDRGFILPNSASNIPTWNYTLQSPTLHVNWKPGHMFLIPSDRFTFEVGETIECWSDGYPAPIYYWFNGATNEETDGQTLLLTSANVGTTTFRCNAQNAYGSNDLFVQITVTAPTVPTTTPIPTTTTPAPAEGACKDLTGRWTSTMPSVVDLCLEVNGTNGQIVGLMRNATDPYFIETRGKIQPNKFDEIGFIGVWPVNIGTQAFVGVCSACFGVEHLQVTAVGRVIGDFNNCNDFGQLRRFAFYDFTRTGPPCRSLFKEHGIKL